MSSSALWQRFLVQGDEESCARVFDAERDRVWTICARYLGAGEDAEEAFQSAWARMLAEARAGRVTAGQAQELMCRMAGREADALRKRRSRRRGRETPMERMPEGTHDGVAMVEDKDRRAAMEALVAQLPEKLRLPVQLHYLNGMTQRQVAAALGVPPSTVDSRLKVALDKLRPLAERAGLRDALGVLVAGGMSAGLLTAPASLTAAGAWGATAASGIGVGILGTATAKIAAVAAIVVVTAGVGVGVMMSNGSRVAIVNETAPVEVVQQASDAPKPHGADSPEWPASVTLAPVREAIEEESADEDNVEVAAEAVSEPEESAAVAEEEAEPTRYMTILVTDADSGEVVEGAEALVRRGKYRRTTTTDAEGLARLEDVPLGSTHVDVTAPGYAQGSVLLEIDSTDPVVTMELEPGTVLHGLVLDEKGMRIPNAHVIVSNTLGSYTFETRSGEDGTYEIAHVVRGVPLYQVYLQHPGYQTYFQHEKVVVPENADRYEHNIVLEGMAFPELTGVVVDAATGRSIAGARVRGKQQMREEPIGATDGAGRFRVSDYTADNNELLFVAKGYAPKAVSLDTITGGTVRVEMERGLVASGVLVDEQDQPIEGANMVVWAESMHFIANTTTDERGAFLLEDLDARAVIWVHPPWKSDSIGLRNYAGKTNERIVIERQVPVRGRVVDADSGEPIATFRVRLGFPSNLQRGEKRPDGITTVLIDPGVVFDSESGTFAIGEFPRGTVLALTVEAEGYKAVELGRVVAGDEGNGVEIRMRK